MSSRTLYVGQLLRGYCAGFFGRDSYSYQDKRVEAIGYDWIVARTDDGPIFVRIKVEDHGELIDSSESPETEIF